MSWSLTETPWLPLVFGKPQRPVTTVENARRFWQHCKRPKYVIGVDIATGTGSSNSVMSVADSMTAKKWLSSVAQIQGRRTWSLCRCLGRYFRDANGRDAYMIWEAPGPGRNFGDVVLESGYRSIYYREQENLVTKLRTKRRVVAHKRLQTGSLRRLSTCFAIKDFHQL